MKDLQKLLGALVWASPFIPRYKRLVRPIEALLSAKEGATWTPECTENLNQLLAIVHQHFALAMVDYSLPITMAISYEGEVGSAVCL